LSIWLLLVAGVVMPALAAVVVRARFVPQLVYRYQPERHIRLLLVLAVLGTEDLQLAIHRLQQTVVTPYLVL
jgi:hypothetical protein